MTAVILAIGVSTMVLLYALETIRRELVRIAEALEKEK